MKEHTLQEIRDRAADDIIELVRDHADVKLKRSGSYMMGKCPFHDEKTPSFSVTPSKGMYKCFGCGVSGDAIKFLEEINGWDFTETIEHLADRYGLSLDPKAKQQRAAYHERLESLLPGITEAKADIRRHEKVVLCFNSSQFKKAGSHFKAPVLYLDEPRISRQQMQILMKYAGYLSFILICKGLTEKQLFKASYTILTTPLKHNRAEMIGSNSLKITDSVDTNPIHWTDFIIKHFNRTESVKKACIKLLARIPNSITAKVYQQRFAESWISSQNRD